MNKTIINILEFFVTFGITDILIYYYYLRKICGCNKSKWYQLLLLSVFGSILKFISPVICYQILFSIILIWYNKLIYKLNILNSVKIVFYFMIFSLLTEITISIIYELFNIVSINKISDIVIFFIYCIPIKFLQIILIRRCKLWDYFGLAKSPKKK